MSRDGLLDVYKRYLKKFEQMFGETDFKETVRFQGRLIRKLKYDDFVAKWTEFKQIENFLKEVMTKGATLNDEVNRSYAELSATVLESPKDFMLL
jgi:hypothetical protein